MDIIFAGSPSSSAEILSTLVDSPFNISLVLTQADKRSSRNKAKEPSEVAKFAESANLPCFKIDSFFDQFPNVKGFLVNVVSSAEKFTYTKTLFGRKRFIRELASSNFQLKAMGKRIAMNAPIQGTASDIMKIAMIKVRVALNNFDNASLLLQIHDEIVVEAKKKDVDKVSLVVSKNMHNAVKLDVPLYVNTKISTSLANFNN